MYSPDGNWYVIGPHAPTAVGRVMFTGPVIDPLTPPQMCVPWNLVDAVFTPETVSVVEIGT